MYLSKLYIENFKLFKQTTIHFNETLNVLTGANNSGKTTILEAISLWESCFYKMLNQTQKDIFAPNPRRLVAHAGDYKLGYLKNDWGEYKPAETYVSDKEMLSVRTSIPGDVHHFGEIKNPIFLEATLKEAETEIIIGFDIVATIAGPYKISFKDSKDFDYLHFNRFFKRFPSPINVIYASPIANVQASEDFETYPKVKAKINARESVSVIRNRLYNLTNDKRGVWNQYLDDLSYVLTDREEKIELIFEGNASKEVEISAKIRTNSRGYFTNLSLIGSGTLQIMEILLASHEEKSDFSMILLDEPDSHIHRDIQKRLVRFLSENAKSNQIFISTHNESLIRSINPHFLFHLEGGKRGEYKPIIAEKMIGIERGLQPSHQLKILQSLGNESALDFINALESDVLVFVEGKDDAIYLQKILNNKYSNVKFSKIMYWAFEGIDNLFQEITYYKKIFEQFKNESSLWEKSVVIFDKDYFSREQRTKLMAEMKNSLQIDTYIWNAYTIESTLLLDIPQFGGILQRYAAKKGQKNIDISQLNEEITKQIELLSQLLIARITEFENKGGLGNEILRKKQAIQGDSNLRKKERSGFVQAVFQGAETALAPSFRNEILYDLQAGNVATYSKKEDIEALIRAIYATFEVEIADNFTDFFAEMLAEAKAPRPWITEWDNAIQLIENKQKK